LMYGLQQIPDEVVCLAVVHDTWSLQSMKQQKRCTSFQQASSTLSLKQTNVIKR